MQKTIEIIPGDTAGVTYQFSVYRIEGSEAGAPSAYLQAALHAGELPGVVAIHALMPMLRKAESEGRVKGDITIVPAANPIGGAQFLFGEHQGRFHLGTRINFNREHFRLERPDAGLIPEEAVLPTADRRLKARLLKLSLGHDIVLDLHCDDVGVLYLYVPAELWPAMEDCAAALGAEAIVLWDGVSDGEFEEASIRPFLAAGADLSRKVVTTVELRGMADVDPRLAERDAAGLYRLLVGRGVIDDPNALPAGAFGGVVTPIGNVEMVKTPKAGAVLYDVVPGERVEKGQRLARIVHAPGEEDGMVDIHAPQAGFVLTRRSVHMLRAHDDVLKLLCAERSATARPGALEE